jgi:hypothetical protein
VKATPLAEAAVVLLHAWKYNENGTFRLCYRARSCRFEHERFGNMRIDRYTTDTAILTFVHRPFGLSRHGNILPFFGNFFPPT